MLGSNFLYEEGDGADEDLQENLPKKLALCPAGGVQDGAQLVIEDFTQNLEVFCLLFLLFWVVFMYENVYIILKSVNILVYCIDLMCLMCVILCVCIW